MSNTRVAFAILPGEPHFSGVIEASQRITDAMANRNIIDASRFPPHVSLHICSIPTLSLDRAFAHLRSSCEGQDLTPALSIAQVRAGSRGYVTCDLDATPGLQALHEWALQAAAIGRGYAPQPGPETTEERYGSRWIRNQFSPHYSIAKVDENNQSLALRMVKPALLALRPAAATRFEVCDIGARSEKWQTLLRLP